jgi:hypothetical protein
MFFVVSFSLQTIYSHITHRQAAQEPSEDPHWYRQGQGCQGQEGQVSVTPLFSSIRVVAVYRLSSCFLSGLWKKWFAVYAASRASQATKCYSVAHLLPSQKIPTTCVVAQWSMDGDERRPVVLLAFRSLSSSKSTIISHKQKSSLFVHHVFFLFPAIRDSNSNRVLLLPFVGTSNFCNPCPMVSETTHHCLVTLAAHAKLSSKSRQTRFSSATWVVSVFNACKEGSFMIVEIRIRLVWVSIISR